MMDFTAGITGRADATVDDINADIASTFLISPVAITEPTLRYFKVEQLQSQSDQL
jgi:hypothetical protein